MARNLIIPGSKALFIGNNLATGVHGSALTQLTRVTSITVNIEDQREDVVQYGNINPIGKERVGSPTVTLDFSYYVAGADNENALGFNLNGAQSMLRWILDKTRDERNYFVFIAPEGQDAAGLTGADGKVKSFGNGFISSYSIQGSVGSFPTATVQVQLSNAVAHTDGVAEQIPAIDFTTGLRVTGNTFTIPTVITSWAGVSGTQPNVTRPGDISLDLSAASGWFYSIPSGCVQSFNLTVPMNRQPIQCLGQTFAKSRDLTFPIVATLQVEMYAGDYVADSLDQIICRTGTYTANLTFREPNCQGTGSRALGFTLKGMSLDSENETTNNIGEVITLNYSIPIGGTGDTTRGVYLSGIVY
jgi:hypothetical protein